jgi:hypothetical protein
MLAAGRREHFFRSFSPGLFEGQADQGLRRQEDVPMLLKQIDILAGIHVRPVDLLLIDRRIGQRDEFNGLDYHEGLLYETSPYPAPPAPALEGQKWAEFPF